MIKVEIYCKDARSHLNEKHYYEYLFSNQEEVYNFLINHQRDEFENENVTQHWSRIEITDLKKINK